MNISNDELHSIYGGCRYLKLFARQIKKAIYRSLRFPR